MEVSTRYNYYDVLEVSPLSPQHEITEAYQRAKVTYSGENPAIYTVFSPEEARELLHLIEEAYSVLGNKVLRALYDEKLGQGTVSLANSTCDALKAESKSRTIQNQIPKRGILFRLDYPVDIEFEEKISSMGNWTGQILKQVREYKQVSLEKLSEVTKISPYYIQAIESMDSGNLPAKVFVRGYVSQICKTLNLKERVVCESYMKHFVPGEK